METSKILKHNSQELLDDLKRVKDVIVYAEKTDCHFEITKSNLLRRAESKHINYYVFDCLGTYTMVVR